MVRYNQPVSMTRLYGVAITVVTLVAVAWPVTRPPIAGDSFPLSTYPMFAQRRPAARMYLEYVVAVGPEARRRHVPPALVASPEVMQAIMSVHQAIARGDAAGLCRRVAARLARRPSYDRFDEVQVVAGNHAAIAYLVDGRHGQERILASCPIVRPGPP